VVGVKMDNEKRLWKKLWDNCIDSKNPLCTRIRDRSAQLQSLGWRYPVCPTDSRIDLMFVGINPRKNANVKIEYNDFEEYYEESKEKSFMNDPHFKKFHRPLLRKIKKEGYHPTSFFTEIILCPTKDGVGGLGKRDEDIIANTCTSKYLKELIKIEMPKVIVAEGNLPVTTIRKQFGLTDGEVQVTKNENIGKREIISVDHNKLCLIWSPHPNAWIPKKVISKRGVIERICKEIVSIFKVS
jgi:hypothetical protein